MTFDDPGHIQAPPRRGIQALDAVGVAVLVVICAVVMNFGFRLGQGLIADGESGGRSSSSQPLEVENMEIVCYGGGAFVRDYGTNSTLSVPEWDWRCAG